MANKPQQGGGILLTYKGDAQGSQAPLHTTYGYGTGRPIPRNLLAQIKSGKNKNWDDKFINSAAEEEPLKADSDPISQLIKVSNSGVGQNLHSLLKGMTFNQIAMLRSALLSLYSVFDTVDDAELMKNPELVQNKFNLRKTIKRMEETMDSMRKDVLENSVKAPQQLDELSPLGNTIPRVHTPAEKVVLNVLNNFAESLGDLPEDSPQHQEFKKVVSELIINGVDINFEVDAEGKLGVKHAYLNKASNNVLGGLHKRLVNIHTILLDKYRKARGSKKIGKQKAVQSLLIHAGITKDSVVYDLTKDPNASIVVEGRITKIIDAIDALTSVHTSENKQKNIIEALKGKLKTSETKKSIDNLGKFLTSQKSLEGNLSQDTDRGKKFAHKFLGMLGVLCMSVFDGKSAKEQENYGANSRFDKNHITNLVSAIENTFGAQGKVTFEADSLTISVDQHTHTFPISVLSNARSVPVEIRNGKPYIKGTHSATDSTEQNFENVKSLLNAAANIEPETYGHYLVSKISHGISQLLSVSPKFFSKSAENLNINFTNQGSVTQEDKDFHARKTKEITEGHERYLGSTIGDTGHTPLFVASAVHQLLKGEKALHNGMQHYVSQFKNLFQTGNLLGVEIPEKIKTVVDSFSDGESEKAINGTSKTLSTGHSSLNTKTYVADNGAEKNHLLTIRVNGVNTLDSEVTDFASKVDVQLGRHFSAVFAEKVDTMNITEDQKTALKILGTSVVDKLISENPVSNVQKSHMGEQYEHLSKISSALQFLEEHAEDIDFDKLSSTNTTLEVKDHSKGALQFHSTASEHFDPKPPAKVATIFTGHDIPLKDGKSLIMGSTERTGGSLDYVKMKVNPNAGSTEHHVEIGGSEYKMYGENKDVYAHVGAAGNVSELLTNVIQSKLLPNTESDSLRVHVVEPYTANIPWTANLPALIGNDSNQRQDTGGSVVKMSTTHGRTDNSSALFNKDGDVIGDSLVTQSPVGIPL